LSDDNTFPNLAEERKRVAELLKAGFERLAVKDYEGALLEFDSARRFDPTCGFASLLSSACLVQLNRTDEANESLENSSSTSSGALTHILQSQILNAREQYDEAEHELWQAVAADVSEAFARVELGRFLYSRNRLGEAREQLERAIQIDSKNAEAHLLVGLSYLGSSEFESATTPVETALALEPLNDRAMALYGYLLMIRAYKLFQTPTKLVGYENAIEALGRALALNPHNELAIEGLKEAEAVVARIGKPSDPPAGFDSWREPFRWLLIWIIMIVFCAGYFALLVWLDESFGSETFWVGMIITSVVFIVAFCLAILLRKDYSALPPSIISLAQRFSREKKSSGPNEEHLRETQ